MARCGASSGLSDSTEKRRGKKEVGLALVLGRGRRGRRREELDRGGKGVPTREKIEKGKENKRRELGWAGLGEAHTDIEVFIFLSNFLSLNFSFQFKFWCGYSNSEVNF